MDSLILSERDRRRFEKFLKRDPETGCLLWQGHRMHRGYGVFRLRGKIVKAHRVAFVNGGGILTPERPLVLHKCPTWHNPACCEFTHLAAGNGSENGLDMAGQGTAGRQRKTNLPLGVQPCGAKFRAQVRLDGKNRHLGVFDTPEEAHAVAMAARTPAQEVQRG